MLSALLSARRECRRSWRGGGLPPGMLLHHQPGSETSVDRETRCNVTAETLSVRTCRCTERQDLQAPRCLLQPKEASCDIPSMTSLITAAQGAQKLPSPSLGDSGRPDDPLHNDHFLPSQISHQSNLGHLSCSWGFGRVEKQTSAWPQTSVSTQLSSSLPACTQSVINWMPSPLCSRPG